MTKQLVTVPITQAEAKRFIARHHRHHPAPVGSIFQVAVARDGVIVGVAVVGRPVARERDDGWTAEVTRLCTLDSPAAEHAASKLYAACWRIAREMGYARLGTYTLASEAGTSLLAAGWRPVYEVKGRSWTCQSRPRVDKHPTVDKTLWSAS